MLVGVVGSRTWSNSTQVTAVVQALIADGHEVATGCARAGVDRMVRAACKRAGVEPRVFYADWRFYNLAAGPIRNRKLVEAVDEVIAFRARGKSNGTDSVIALARRAGKPCKVIRPG